VSKKKFTTIEVARAIGATNKTVARYADRGAIKCEVVQFGRNRIRLFDPAAVRAARALHKKNIERHQKPAY
jgi:DNA-binding transcriptional MerR regulator